MTLTTLIIDDSKMQELLTLKMVNENPNLSCIGSYNDPKEGLKAANELKPDVIILDVEMPEMSGFDVVASLDCDCQVLLYSTRPEFAFSAFHYEQVKDFITKPMRQTRFQKSVEKLVTNLTAKNKATLNLSAYSNKLSLAS